MNTIVLDAGALIALDRNDRATWALLRAASADDDLVLVPTGALAQAWRDGPRQARLAQALDRCEEVPLDGIVARSAGLLCGRAGTPDVIDASVALAAAATSAAGTASILTSDPDDLDRLVSILGRPVGVIGV